MVDRSEHDERFRRWQSRAPDKTRMLSELLVSRFAPIIESSNFKKVDYVFGQPQSPVEGRELRFERSTGSFVDVVYAFFDKYDSPRFQIGFSRRKLHDASQIVRSGHLVKTPAEYYHEWGKPRWWPTALWSSKQQVQTIDHVARATNQVLSFLESGERGPNISKPTTAEA